ncbi:MAG: oxidoreductase, partial [Arthrobacter sp.]|nr:oxidoreductase [Arthrobacter sp.]
MTEASHTEASNTKAAVVTGASTGIGEATVRALRGEGWTVYAVARRQERLAALEAETGAVGIPGDIAEDGDVARILAEVTAGGGIDTLINIAGGARGADPVA